MQAFNPSIPLPLPHLRPSHSNSTAPRTRLAPLTTLTHRKPRSHARATFRASASSNARVPDGSGNENENDNDNDNDNDNSDRKGDHAPQDDVGDPSPGARSSSGDAVTNAGARTTDWTIEGNPHFLRPPDAVPTSEQLHTDLVTALSSPSNRPDGRGDRGDTIEHVITRLESLNVSPQTPAFAELALSGEWRLLFSSFRTQLRERVRVRSLTQTFDPGERLMLNRARWSFPDRSGQREVVAVLEVRCSYAFTQTPGRLQIELQTHKMSIVPRADGEENLLPENMREVIADLQVALPFEHFDPSGTVDVSYVDTRFRIARFVGKRLAGVRDVFEKVA